MLEQKGGGLHLIIVNFDLKCMEHDHKILAF